MAAFFEGTSRLGMLVYGHKRSLFALFSPKLWTVLNQYGAGGPCVMSFREWPPGIEFENLSLDQFKPRAQHLPLVPRHAYTSGLFQRHLIKNAAAKVPSRAILANPAPLLEEERCFRLST